MRHCDCAFQEKQKEQEAYLAAKADDDREINKYGKLLRLNKRKSKTISQGFRNDGLDCILLTNQPTTILVF